MTVSRIPVKMERVVCEVCGKTVAARVPRGGDGSALQPVPHKGPGTEPDHVCPGHWQLVEVTRADLASKALVSGIPDTPFAMPFVIGTIGQVHAVLDRYLYDFVIADNDRLENELTWCFAVMESADVEQLHVHVDQRIPDPIIHEGSITLQSNRSVACYWPRREG